MRRFLLLSCLLLLAAAASAAENAAFFEVRNAGPRLFQHVVEHKGKLADLFPAGLPLKVRVVETDPSGRRTREAVGQLDFERGEVVLSLLLGGITEPRARRCFLVTKADELPSAETDLRLHETDSDFLLSNQYFTAHVAKKGRGGFPDQITFNGSGNTYDNFFYGDRVYTKERGTLHLRDDPNSTARIVSRGPLRIVVETIARYASTPLGTGGPPGRYASGDARAVYRYVYRAYSPIVDVTCKATRADDYRWREIHFLQVSRKDTLFSHWLGGEPLQKGAFLNTRKSHLLKPWGVMHNADDAVGLAHPNGVIHYDGIDYVNYLQTPVPQWTTRTYENAARLYFGPAHKNPQRYAQRLAGGPRVEIRQLPVPKAAAPPAVAAKYRLQSDAITLEFADEAAGLGLARLANRLTAQDLVLSPNQKPMLWRLELRSEDKGLKPVRIDNRVQARCSAKVSEGKLDLRWEGIGLPDEPAAISVRVTVALADASSASSWRITVDNRSKRYGVWDVFFPVMANVGPDERPDVAVPRSNWGMLYRECRHRQGGWYPSCNWPMQFLCVNRAESGLYLACHDPEAWPKRFSLTPLGEFHFQVHAPNQGVAGTGYTQPFPIVVGAYKGNWWQGAKLYRRWAIANAPWARKGPLTKRKDTPKKLLDLGLWMLGGGGAKGVVANMRKAAELFRVPIGIHWYNWHQIPFDTHYPNYFPTKPGFAEAVRELTGKGMVIMPYINGRLWDSGNENFRDALPFACKSPEGKPYIEIYGSKRPLAVMCPYTRFWQDKVNEICRRLMTECGVNAIYIDQIAAAGPRLCYDKRHKHSIGGGSWWVDGYREMLTPIRQMAHADSRDVILTTENNTECYMDNVDAFLTWNPRYDNEIPMMTAVYSGYTTYFASISSVGDTLKAFAMSQGRDFLFGVQPGWMGFELLERKNREKAYYLRDLATHRLAAAKFMIHGELLGELKPVSPVPKVEVTWGRNRPHKAVLPAVMATVWRSRDGELAIAATNWDEGARLFRYRLDPDAWGRFGVEGKPPSQVVFSRLSASGEAYVGCAPYGPTDRDLMLRPREVCVLAVRPSPPLHELLDQLAEQIRRARPRSRVPGLTGSIAKRCRALLAVPGDPRALVEPLGVRQAKRCALEALAADMGVTAMVEPAAVVAAAGHSYRVVVTLHNGGRQRLSGICSLRGYTRPYTLSPGDRAEVELFAQAPHLTTDEAAAHFEHVRVHLAPDEREPALELPVSVATVRPFTVAVEVERAPRAGEAHLVRATVTNRTSLPASPTVLLHVPAGWEVSPCRRVRLPAMKGGETRVVTFLCSVPRDAIPGRTRIAASVVYGGATKHIDVKPPRPQAKAKHRNGAPTIDGELSDWKGVNPVAVAGGSHVRIENWKGPNDCSAKVWTGWNAEHFFVAADVRDDVFDQKHTGFPVWQGDCIQMAICPGRPRGEPGYEGVVELGLALTPKGPQAFRWIPAPRELSAARLVIRRSEGRLAYEAAIPWASLGEWRPARGATVGWSFTVNDADGEGFRGWLEWTPGICGGKDASRFGRLQFEP